MTDPTTHTWVITVRGADRFAHLGRVLTHHSMGLTVPPGVERDPTRLELVEAPHMPRWTGVPLTGREKQVLHGLAEGLSSTRIGAALYVAPSTVKVHLKTLYRKLGARNRAQAVYVACQWGLL